VLDAATATKLLQAHMSDNYKDDPQADLQLLKYFKYKLYVPVHKNRSIETTATLFDNKLNVLHKFTIRTHGQFVSDSGRVARNMVRDEFVNQLQAKY